MSFGFKIVKLKEKNIVCMIATREIIRAPGNKALSMIVRLEYLQIKN